MSDGHRALMVSRVGADLLVLLVAPGLAFVARFSWDWFAYTEDPDLGWRPYFVAGLIWSAVMLRALVARAMYDEDTLVPGGAEIIRCWKALPEAVAVLAFVAFLVRGEQLSRSWFLLTVALTALVLPGERLVFRKVLASLRHRGWLRRPVILVLEPGGLGSGEPVPRRLAEFDVIAEVTPESLTVEELDRVDGVPYLIDSAEWDRDVLWETVVAVGARSSSVFVLSGLRAVSAERMMTRDLDGRSVTRISPPHLAGVRAAEKRALDLIVVVLLAIPAMLVGLVFAILQLVTDGRPILYRQERLGRDGNVFRMWKFRSMEVGAESESGPVWAGHDDPRRTKLGGFLRRSSLDELPQLWNVLMGDMSMVGPRPERPEFVEQFSEEMRWYRHRLRIKPGLTGRAQALGLRGQTPLATRVEEDNWYIENWSLALDVQILARTVTAVIKGTNAE